MSRFMGGCYRKLSVFVASRVLRVEVSNLIVPRPQVLTFIHLFSSQISRLQSVDNYYIVLNQFNDFQFSEDEVCKVVYIYYLYLLNLVFPRNYRTNLDFLIITINVFKLSFLTFTDRCLGSAGRPCHAGGLVLRSCCVAAVLLL